MRANFIERIGERNIVLLIVVVAFTAEIAFLRAPTFFGEPYLVAKNIVAGKGYVFEYPLTGRVLPSCYVTPLYVWIQVPFLYFGLGERGIQILNLLFLQVGCFVLYRFFRNFTTRGLSLLIFAALSFYVPFWILAYTLDPNTLNLLLLALTVERVYAASEKPSTKLWVQLGILIGLQLLLRPDMMLGGALFVAWLLFWNRNTWKGIALAAVIAIAMCLPWTVRNYLDFHKFVFVSANAGMNLFEGNNPVATGEFSQLPPTDASRRLFAQVTAFQNTHFDGIDIDRYRFDLSKQWILGHPAEVLMLDLKKIWYHWFGRPIMGEQFHYTFQAFAHLYRIAGAILVLLGFYGLWCIRDNRLRTLILSVFIYSTLISAIFFVQSRHRILKVDPFLIPLAVIALNSVAVTFRSRSRSIDDKNVFQPKRDLKVTTTERA
ncbi:MAG TPA: glycosyltransferase family 39 protein [Candidatus Kapabacteria bacterium]